MILNKRKKITSPLSGFRVEWVVWVIRTEKE